MPTATGEVLLTDAPTGTTTNWRLLRGGTEYGRFSSQHSNDDLTLNAVVQDMRFLSSNTYRMRLSGTYTGQVVNGYAGLDLSGYLGVGTFMGSGTPRPLTLLHLDYGGTTVFGFRPWMRTGTLMTERTDLMYVGTKRLSNDRIDGVINWADNNEDNPTFGPDRLRFIFTRAPGGGSTAASTDGLELMRIIPATNGNEGFVGIGDFNTAAVEPDTRLDVLNGKVRIRTLPTDAASSSNELVMLNMTTGVLEHKPAGTLPDNCEWSFQSATDLDVITASGSPSGCPGDANNVGIGVGSPTAKLDVLRLHTTGADYGAHIVCQGDNVGGDNMGLWLETRADGGTGSNVHYGLTARASQASYANYGVHARSVGLSTSSYSIGVHGEGQGSSTYTTGVEGVAVGDKNNYGTTGTAYIADSTLSNIGIRGMIGYNNGVSNIQNTWAGWFNYKVLIQGDLKVNATWYTSDEGLKTDIADIDDAVSLLGQLHPKTYRFQASAHPALNLPTSSQIGFLAQDVRDVLPQLVTTTTTPVVVDSAGTVVTPSETYMGINYVGIIPLLVRGTQQQQAIIEQQQQALSDLQDAVQDLRTQLNACCNNPNGDTRSLMQQGASSSTVGTTKEALTITPNPFTDHTTLGYTVPQAGRIRLEVATGDGRKLKTLREEEAQAGTFTYEWNTSGLSAGTYLVTLLLDEKVIVKKAVKVGQ